MNRQQQQKGSAPWIEPLERLAVQPFPSADLVLLCAFTPDLTHTRTHKELRRALRSAAYSGPLSRHLIISSPLLWRRPGNQFALRQFAS